MVILTLHNFYQQPGGEDAVFRAETALLKERGHEVVHYTLHNDAVNAMSSPALARATFWNRRAYRDIRSLIRSRRPSLVHVHNTLPLISPSAYYAAKHEGVAVVQSLHNYRLFCPNGLFFRDDRVCMDCSDKLAPWPSVVHGCYRGSRPATAVVASMLSAHRALGTWHDAIDTYIALTSFSRQVFVDCGLPGERVVVKPNFMHPDPGVSSGKRELVLFAGRLSEEKGISTLLTALEKLGGRVPACIVGDGPLAGRVEQAVSALPGLTWLGHRPPDEVCELIGSASLLVVPSRWFENFPRVLVESFARGTPVIASELGALAEIVNDGENGFVVPPGDADALADRIERALSRPDRLAELGANARVEFERKYSAEPGYRNLMEIYEHAQARAALPATG